MPRLCGPVRLRLLARAARLAGFALGEDQGRVKSGQQHDRPEEGADHHPEQPTAQRRWCAACSGLRPLTEEMAVGKA